MIKYIQLKNAGPVPGIFLEPGSRLNILTGDNGVGKTFVLDTAWWALTCTWAEQPILPGRSVSETPGISFETSHTSGPLSSEYDFQAQLWPVPRNRFIPDTLVIYARVSGGISVFDPLRKRDGACHFTQKEIWNGLHKEDRVLCNGLIRDWITWQYQKEDIFRSFQEVLKQLSPGGGEIIRPGKPVRVSVEDARDIPSVQLPYGQVPITHISAGMRRILSLAYIMIWAWTEHRETVHLMNQNSLKKFLFLFDEAEAHLHPQWQRILLPALFKAIEAAEPGLETQMLVSTHAPLVLASAETEFCEDTDRILNFELSNGKVLVKDVPWAKQGDVANCFRVTDQFFQS